MIEDEEVTHLPCLPMTCNGYEVWEMKLGDMEEIKNIAQEIKENITPFS